MTLPEHRCYTDQNADRCLQPVVGKSFGQCWHIAVYHLMDDERYHSFVSTSSSLDRWCVVAPRHVAGRLPEPEVHYCNVVYHRMTGMLKAVANHHSDVAEH